MAGCNVTFYCPAELWEAWKAYAEKRGKSASEALREAMEARISRAG